MGFLRKLLGRDDKKNKGTLTMSGPSPRRMSQVSPGTIDISAPMTASRLPMVLNSLGRTRDIPSFEKPTEMMKKGGKVGASKMGKVKTSKPSMGSASKRADGVAQRGKTRGKMV
jgi:hypothetical protein